MSYVKICGVCCERDVELVVEAGASAIGFNLWPSSPRFVDEALAAKLIAAAGRRVETVVVTVDHPQPHRLRQRLDADWVQLHGDEERSVLMQRGAFKAVGLTHDAELGEIRPFFGERLLVDARDTTLRGGTGRPAPRARAAQLAAQCRLILAGGLDPDNVATAIDEVRPWGVDTASGVESAPGIKDRERLFAFVAAARDGFRRLSTEP